MRSREPCKPVSDESFLLASTRFTVTKTTNHIVPLEIFQNLNEIMDSICASNDYHSFRYWPLLAGNNSALSAPSAIQYIIYCSCFL